MSACSTGLAPAAAAWASFSASHAAFARSSGTTGLLMCGPFATATPQKAIAHFGSSSAARRNARIASSWLNAYRKARPWSKYRCASGDVVVTFRDSPPRPSKSGTDVPSAASPPLFEASKRSETNTTARAFATRHLRENMCGSWLARDYYRRGQVLNCDGWGQVLNRALLA